MRHSNYSLAILLAVAIGTVLSSGCATKKYVRQRIDERVAPLENRTGELEETSRRNSSEISRLSTEVTDARSRADRAQQSANAAQNTANNAVSRAEAIDRRVTEVDEKIANIDAFSLQRTVTVNFKLSRATLDEEAIAVLDQLAAELQGKKGYVLEIQGFTDSTGSDMRNRDLSERRARAVYQYLAERDVPLFRMNLLGFGEGRPVAENDSREGRAQNRRVEVRILVTPVAGGEVGAAATE
jgi:outer membrane protein OmpA-like peptidoglycan-associated protein